MATTSSLDRVEEIARHVVMSIDTAVEERKEMTPLSSEGVAGVSTADPVVIVDACRTPICKARRGGFKDTTPDVLLGAVLEGSLARTKIHPTKVGDVVVGNVLQPGAGANMARMAQLCSGFDYSTPISVVNRQCSSGLAAVMQVASSIEAGHYDIGIGAGVESMSLGKIGADAPDVEWNRVGESEAAQQCLTPMGITSENVAERYGVDRSKQDQLAAASHDKATVAQENNLFEAEIVPVVTVLDDEPITVSKDDGVRTGTTAERLAKLKPAFKPGGTTTAGNSSQVSDGAAACMLMKASTAKSYGLDPLASVVSYSVVGVEPSVMGIGPAVAIPDALRKAGLTVDDIDVYEINEAFASQAVYCVEKLKIPMEKVNPLGGAIALGHPLGCTGARQIATLCHELKRRGGGYGVVSMCIGTGMGAAAVFKV